MKVNFIVQVQDVTAVIEDAVANIGDVSGIGANGDSAYEIVSVNVTTTDEVNFDVEVEVERTEGLFASKDDVGEALVDALNGETLDVPVEASY